MLRNTFECIFPQSTKALFSARLRSLSLLSAFWLLLLLGACRTPSADLSRQKLVQVAVLLSYDHPSAYRNIEAGLVRAMQELSQVNAVIFGAETPAPQTRRELRLARRRKRWETRNLPEQKPNLKASYADHVAWKKEQIRQIIDANYDVLVLFGDELIDLDQSLLAAQEAGLLIVYCGLNRKPLISRDALARQEKALQPYKSPLSPYDYPQTESPQHSILNQSAERGSLLAENYEGNPIDQADTPPPYINADALSEEGPETVVALPQDTKNNQAVQGLVNINISPIATEPMLRRLEEFLTGTAEYRDNDFQRGPFNDNFPNDDFPEEPDRASYPEDDAVNELRQRSPLEPDESRPNPAQQKTGQATQLQTASTLLLFGPAELPFSQMMYHNMRDIIAKHRDSIQAVRFLDPLHVNSQDQIRRLVLELPADGRIIAMEPLLLYSSSQIMQRYGLGMKVAGLGWHDLSDPLLASKNIQILIPLQYDALAYASLYASFALYNGQKQGRSGENFMLGSYGQRQVGFDGTLILSNSAEAYNSPPEPRTQAYKRPRRVPRNPNRRTILSEEDLRR